MPALQRSQGRSAGHSEVVMAETGLSPDPFVQNLFVLCHGEQVSNVSYVDTKRPWDPPLTARGKLQAWRVGRKILLEDWNVTRIVVSPLLRCVQTAIEVIAGLSMLPSSYGVSSIKVSIESGLVDNLEELYSMLPTAMHDPGFQLTKHKQGESTEDGGNRYTSTLKKITNASPHENILCITYGEGMRQAMSMMWPPMEMHEVTHCAYSHAQRAIFEDEDDDSCFLSSDWELLTESGSSSGLFFTPACT